MNLSKEYVNIYNQYLKLINDTKKEIKSIRLIQKITTKRQEKVQMRRF